MFKKLLSLMIILSCLGLVACDQKSDLSQEGEMEQSLRGTITDVEQGKDGLQVTLETDDLTYSVAISFIKAEIFGHPGQITKGADIEVSGNKIDGSEPLLFVADQVKLLSGEIDYVINLFGTVDQVEMGKDGITASVKDRDGTIYQTVISFVTTEIHYVEPADQIQEGSVLIISGKLLDLEEVFISAEKVEVNPIIPVDSN